MAHLVSVATRMSMRALEEHGWEEVADVRSDEALFDLASSLGEPGSLSRLRPAKRASAVSRSLSFHYGLGQFPMHSDTAFWAVPARYVVLRSIARSCAPTLLFPAPQLKKTLRALSAREAIFSVRTIEGSFYSGVFLGASDDYIRFDPCYMKCSNIAARQVLELMAFPDPSCVQEFHWTGDNALIIDNWRCLHGRGAVGQMDQGRELSRIYAMGNGK